MKMNQKFQEQK